MSLPYVSWKLQMYGIRNAIITPRNSISIDAVQQALCNTDHKTSHSKEMAGKNFHAEGPTWPGKYTLCVQWFLKDWLLHSIFTIYVKLKLWAFSVS